MVRRCACAAVGVAAGATSLKCDVLPLMQPNDASSQTNGTGGIGFNEGKRTPLEGKTIELDGRVFDNSQSSMDLIYLLALAEGRDAMILHPDREDEVATIFEEFSATGLGVLDRWMKECSDDLNGDRAILTALRKEGFLKKSSGPSVNNVIDQVQF